MTRVLTEIDENLNIALPVPQTVAAEKVTAALPVIRACWTSGASWPQFAWSIVNELNKLPTDTTVTSAANAVANLARIGLTPGESMGHAYISTFLHSKGRPNERRIAQVMIGYKGFLELAFANNFLKVVQADVVLDGEDFSLERREFGPELHHPIPLNRDICWDGVVAAYCTYTTALGGNDVEIVTRQQLNEISRNWKRNNLPFVPMALKTPIRRAAKRWRLTQQMANAIQLDEMADRDAYQDLGNLPDGVTEDQAGSLDELESDANDR